MVKNVIPQKARKFAASAGSGPSSAASSHKKSSGGGGGRKHGGLGAHNAFENLTYRSKHEVLSLAKPKGKLKRPAAAQSAQLAARQQSLLAEIGSRDKANSFVDERLEESNTSIDVEDKLLLRFQKERQKRLAASTKAARFGLHDEGDDMQLTHGGQALSLAPAVRRPEGEEGEDDEDEDAQDARLAAASRVDGEDGADDGADEDGNESGHKSRHDVMSEVMLKSKMFRAERAVLAGEQQDLMGNLDSEFDLVRAGMDWASKEDRIAAKRGARASETNTGEINAAKKAAKKAGAGADAGEGETERDVDGDVVFVDGQLDPTDEFVLEAKQLGLQVRAKASDRLKSDEEVIAQEKRRLEKLERQRLKRMRGESDAHEDDDDDGEDPDTPAAKRRRQRKEVKESLKKAAAAAASNRRATDDDLEQNFKLTSKAVGGRPADQVADHELISDDEEGGDDDEDEEEDDEDDSDEDGEDEEEEADENDEAMDALPEEDDKPLKAVFIGSTPAAAASSKQSASAAAAAKPAQKEIFIGNDGKSSVSAALLAITAKLAGGAGAKPADSAAASSGGASSSAASTIPFTFAAPTSYNDFKATLAPYPADQHSLIIARIRTCNHISLAPENRGKMEKFYAILLTHFRRTAQEFQKRPDLTKDATAVAALVAKLDMIGKHLSELNEIPSMNAAVGRAFRAQLVKMRASLDAEDGPGSFEPDQILLMKLAASLFPTSDFRHNVVTPLLLLQAEWLNRLVIASASDVIKGFLVVSLMLHEINESKRVVPEILTFLHSVLLHGTGMAKAEGERAPIAPAAATAAPASKKQKASTAAASSTTMDTGAPPTGSAGETFSVQPSALRLHNSLQSRNCNFLPSKQLAFWASMLTPTVAAPAAKKNSKKAEASAQQHDLHIPLEWIFMSSDATLAEASPVAAAGAASPLQLCTFSTLLQLIHQSAQLWQATAPSYGELFVPLLDSLGHIVAQQRAGVFAPLSPTLQTYTTHLHTYLSSSIAHSISLRRPLEASLAPFTLKQHTPIFTEGYNPTKDYDPIKERAHIKELGAKLKREKKGAMRELRRDTAVIVAQQRAVSNAYAAERETKRKEVWNQMEEQQRDTNIMHRESKKKQDKKDKSKSRKK